MIQAWTSHEWYGHQVSTLSVKVDPGKRRLFFGLSKEWYHRCLSNFYLLLFHTWGTSKVQFLDTTDNFLTYFKWVDADEEFSTCIWISLIEVWDVNFRRVGTQTKTIEELLCSTLCWLGFNHDQFHTWGIPQLQISDAF